MKHSNNTNHKQKTPCNHNESPIEKKTSKQEELVVTPVFDILLSQKHNTNNVPSIVSRQLIELVDDV